MLVPECSISGSKVQQVLTELPSSYSCPQPGVPEHSRASAQPASAGTSVPQVTWPRGSLFFTEAPASTVGPVPLPSTPHTDVSSTCSALQE